MPRWDNEGIFWKDVQQSRKGGQRELGPMPAIPETNWRPLPASQWPNIRHAKAIAIDTETHDDGIALKKGSGWGKGLSHIVGISFAVEGMKFYLPTKHTVQTELNLDPVQVMKYTQHMLTGPGVKIGANLIYDIGNLAAEGVEVTGALYDVQIAESLIDEMSRLSLDDLGYKYLGVGKTSDVLKKWCQDYYMSGDTVWRKDIHRAPVSLVGPYAEDDADMPLQILKKQWPLLYANNLLDLLHMECKLIPLLIKMRMRGVNIDIARAEELDATFEANAAKLQAKLNHEAGTEININASDSIAKAFDLHGLPYPMTAPSNSFPDGKPSFVKSFLEQHTHKIPKMITELRGLRKLQGTFVQGYLLNSHVNGRVHGEFLLTGTELGGARTGRFASAHPNLQNIPIRTKEGKLIRTAFIPDAGKERWRKLDLSQIEYRFLAHFATGETEQQLASIAELLRRYRDDPSTDYHQMTCDLIKSVTGIELSRGITKNINFGIVYGLGKETLAMYLGVPVKQANELSKQYHDGAPFVRSTMDAIVDEVNATGVVKTVLGRISHFDLWEPDNWFERKNTMPLPFNNAYDQWGEDIIRAYTYRAINYKFQGSAADQLKKAMLQAYEAGIFDTIGVPLLTVHDELDGDDDGSPEMEEGYAALQHEMETAIPLKIPVYCEQEIGVNWGDVKKRTANEGLII